MGELKTHHAYLSSFNIVAQNFCSYFQCLSVENFSNNPKAYLKKKKNN